MKFMKALLMAVSLAVLAAVAQAHHSFAMFDKERVVTIKGTVVKIDWRNPHTYLTVDVPDDKGGKTRYLIECFAPNHLMQAGWKPNMVKTGDEVSVDIFPLRDGRPGGLFSTMTLPNGKVIKP